MSYIGITSKCVLDVRHLLHVVHRPYPQVCEAMSLTLYHYVAQPVVFDGYGNSTSTKTVEHERRASQSISVRVLTESFPS